MWYGLQDLGDQATVECITKSSSVRGQDVAKY